MADHEQTPKSDNGKTEKATDEPKVLQEIEEVRTSEDTEAAPANVSSDFRKAETTTKEEETAKTKIEVDPISDQGVTPVKLIELEEEGKELQQEIPQSRVRTQIGIDVTKTLDEGTEKSAIDMFHVAHQTPKKVLIGKSTKICGSPTVQSNDGEASQQLLDVGDPIYAGDVITNPSNTMTQIELVNGEVVILSDNHSFSADAIATAAGIDLGPEMVVLSSGTPSTFPMQLHYFADGASLLNTSLSGPDGLFFTPTELVFPEYTPSLIDGPENGELVSPGFSNPTLPFIGVLPTSFVPSTSFVNEYIETNTSSIQVRNTSTNPALANNLEVELAGANINGFTFNPGAAALNVPAGGALVMVGNGDWFVYSAGGALVANGNQAALNWAFEDSTGDGQVDTRDSIGVNLKQDATTVIDTFLANGATFTTTLWTSGPTVPAAALALLGTFLSHDTFSGQAGDQLEVLNELGLTHPNVDGVNETTPNDDNNFFVRTVGPDTDSAMDWTTTDNVIQGVPVNLASPNPQDPMNDDFNPQAPNPNVDAGQTVLVGTGGNDLLIGGQGPDILHGENGDDILQGGAHDDILLGGAGNDQLDGGTGADILIDGNGRDFLIGSEGNDILIGNDPVLGQPTSGSDQGDVLVGDIVNATEELFTFNVVIVVDSSQSMGAVAHNLEAAVNGNATLSGHNEFQVRGLPVGSILESTGGYSHVIGAGGYSTSMTKTQLDNLVIQLPAASFAAGATPPAFALDVRGRSAPGSFDEVLGLASADGSSAPIVSVRDAAESLMQSYVQDGFDVTTQVRVVSFNATATVETFGAQTDFNPSDPNLQTVIDSITPMGQASIAVGMQEAVDYLNTVDGTDIIYVFSDGNDLNGFTPSPALQAQIIADNIDVYAYGVSIDSANSNLNLTDLQDVAQLGEFSSSNAPIIINPTNAGDLIDDPTDSIIEVQRLGSDVIIGGDLDDAIFGDALLVDFTQISANSTIPVATLITDFNADPVTFVKTHIVGGTFDNALSSLGQEDFIDGGGGNDVIFGSGGDDEIIGGSGNDLLIGGRGDDHIDAGNQNDGEVDEIVLLNVLDGHDVVYGFDNQGVDHDIVNLDALFDSLGTSSGAARVADIVLTQVSSDVVLTINGVPDFSLRFENSSGNTVGDFSIGTSASDDIFVG